MVDPSSAVTYALTYDEAKLVAEEIGWTKTESWIVQGEYSTQKPGKKLLQLLEPYRMTPEAWQKKVAHISSP